MSLIVNCTIPSRTPLRMAFFTALRICSSLPISVKRRGASIGLICQRRATSIVIPICSLESASIRSTWSPPSGNWFSRAEKRSTEDHGGTKRMPARRGCGETEPKAWRTPTSPGSITATVEPRRNSAPMPNRARASVRSMLPLTPRVPWARSVAFAVHITNATTRRIAPRISLPIRASS